MEITTGDWIQIGLTIAGFFLFIWKVSGILVSMQVKIDTLWDIFVNRRRADNHREDE